MLDPRVMFKIRHKFRYVFLYIFQPFFEPMEFNVHYAVIAFLSLLVSLQLGWETAAPHRRKPPAAALVLGVTGS